MSSSHIFVLFVLFTFFYFFCLHNLFMRKHKPHKESEEKSSTQRISTQELAMNSRKKRPRKVFKSETKACKYSHSTVWLGQRSKPARQKKINVFPSPTSCYSSCLLTSRFLFAHKTEKNKKWTEKKGIRLGMRQYWRKLKVLSKPVKVLFDERNLWSSPAKTLSLEHRDPNIISDYQTEPRCFPRLNKSTEFLSPFLTPDESYRHNARCCLLSPKLKS